MSDHKRPVLTLKRKSSGLASRPAQNDIPKPPSPQQEKLSRKERLARNAEKLKRRGEAGIQLLVQYWPALFSTTQPKPLKIGILDDLLAYTAERGLELSQKLAKDALSIYAKRPAYLTAVSEGTTRFDLHGLPAGEITEKEREYSRKKLDKLREKTEVVGKPDAPAL
ncbi:ProQ/FINO family protein [Yersinia pestis]|nr:ProQ/FINO family protein [Yersinia pestis]